jgi:photosystem II stability/assembly factor-like uncharacterized protein
MLSEIAITFLLLIPAGTPGNTCDTAIVISEGMTPYNTIEYTDSGYSPDSSCDLMGIMNRDIWFSYVAEYNEHITITTCDSNSFDTSIIVYEKQQNCNDLINLTCSGDAPNDAICQPYHSVVQFMPNVNSTYLIRVGGWDTNSFGSGTLTLELGNEEVPNTCATDINYDLQTNVSDILEIINDWGVCKNCPSDITEDGLVNVSDLLAVINAWGPCPLQGIWRVMPSSPVAPYLHHDDIVVIGDTIWICNISGEIWKSTDAGENWTMTCYQEGTSFRCLTFIDELHGWAGNLGPGSWVGSTTDTNPLYQTIDGGETWTPVPLESISGDIPDGICGIHAVDQDTIFGAGRYAGGSYVVKSTDGGLTWISYDLSSDFWTFVDIYFETPLRGYVTGGNQQGQAAIICTEDGGETWTTKINHYSSHYWKMGFASDTFGYGVCSGGNDMDKWVATYDGGVTWAERTFTDDFHANGIGFLNENVGWIGGYPAETLQTVDGGETWEPILIDLAYGDVINRFVKVSEDVIYAVGNRVYKYAPEDEHFTIEHCNEPLFINSKCSIDATVAEGIAKITYTVPAVDQVTLTIFIRGSLIYDRPIDKIQKAGTYTIEWELPQEYETLWDQQQQIPELFVSIQTGSYRQWTKFKLPGQMD